MFNFKKFAIGTAAVCCFAAAPLVHAVVFSTSGVSLQAGSGYGYEFSEYNGSLLDVRFSTAFTPQTFSLNTVNTSQSFTFGNAYFNESDFFGGITAAETNNLGVTANFTFLNPLGITKSLSATGTAYIGSVSDRQTDYTLVFAPVTVDFGTGGKFRIDVNTLSFTDVGRQNLNATITLLALPAVAAVPEPASIALLGLGLMGLAASRYQRSRQKR